jgi:hypothetical protein
MKSTQNTHVSVSLNELDTNFLVEILDIKKKKLALLSKEIIAIDDEIERRAGLV